MTATEIGLTGLLIGSIVFSIVIWIAVRNKYNGRHK
jgi:hypothetical protein